MRTLKNIKTVKTEHIINCGKLYTDELVKNNNSVIDPEMHFCDILVIHHESFQCQINHLLSRLSGENLKCVIIAMSGLLILGRETPRLLCQPGTSFVCIIICMRNNGINLAIPVFLIK